MNLQIQCPKCSKRFTVHEDLSGKTVECGSCDHRFPVKPEAIIVEKTKVYPGEHKSDDFFNRLGRSPGGKAKKSAAPFTPAASVPQVDAIMPASPARNIAAGVGMCVLIFYIVLFLLGTSEGGMFQDMEMVKRVILASFVGIVGLAMVVYGAKNWRFQATMLALVFVATLGALTVIRPVLKTPVVADDVPIRPRSQVEPRQSNESNEESIKARVGYDIVERKLRDFSQEFGPAASGRLVAIFVEDLQPGQFFKLESYFRRAFKIPPNEGIGQYKRNGEKDSLMLISGFPIDFDEAVRICDPRLGRATTYPELRLIDLKLSAIHTSEISDDLRVKMSDPTSSAFFSTNLKALTALNADLVKGSVKTLSTLPEEIELQYQGEIVVEFMRLLGSEADQELLRDLGKAFRRWAGGDRAALVAVSRRVGQWLKNGETVHQDYVEYLVENKEPTALAFVDELWSKEPETWARQFILMGLVAEPRLIEHLEGSSLRLRKSAATILGTIGTELSLSVMAKYQNVSDEELRIIIERAVAAIKAR